MNGDKEKAARLWDELVKRGVPEDEATAKVEAIWGKPDQMVEPEQPRVGLARGLLLKGTQGALMGAGDEIGAAIRAIPRLVPGGKSPLQGFREALESSRGAQQQFSKQHPFLAGAADIGGTIGSAVATGGAGMLARPVVGGAIMGGVEAFNRAEGNPLERAPEAAVGTALGGAVGGTANKVLEVASPLARTLFGNVKDRALGKFAGAVEREGLRPADLSRLAATARPEETILDVVAERGPVQRLGRAVEAIPSKGSKAITDVLADRASRAPTRVRSTLQGKTGLTFEDAVATVDDLVEMRKMSAKVLYDRAYERTVPLAAFGDVFSHAPFRAAYNKGVQLAKYDGVTLPPMEMLANFANGVPVQAVDYMKRGMDELIDKRFRAGKLGTTEARSLRNKVKGMLTRVDEAVPEYKVARDQFAGDTEVMDAFKRGRESFLKEDPRLVSRDLDTMSPSVSEFYRRGALDAVRERLEKSADGRDLSKLLTGNSEMRTRIRALFDTDADYNSFVQEMVRERRMYQTGQFVGGQGSRTTPLAEDVADLRLQNPRLGDLLLIPKRLAASAIDSGIGRRLRNVDEAVVDEIAPMLTKPLSSTGFSLQKALEKYAKQAAERAARRGVGTRTLSAGAGGFVGSSTNRR